MIHLVDSSGWIEYFADGPHAAQFEPLLQDTANLLVPTVVLFEVKKYFFRNSASMVPVVAATMEEALVVDLTPDVATLAAKLSIRHGLHLADSVIFATKTVRRATLWTLDQHFEKLAGPDVRYIRPSKRK
ncbi:MAG: type II toxin-antitoxin system VapC family toxin [Acidobacteria bacterium]|nr:type II toxin-antitoxin system VapC family toxin [Acidobacteriota bacterium]